MSDRLFALRLFTRVARSGSFSRAGREFQMSQPSASRIVANLEREVGAALFIRTTRAVTLTEAGSEYLARIEPLLAELEEADHAARGTGEIRGVLRVGLSSSFAVRAVIPRLPAFLASHKALRVDLLMNDQRQDLLGEGVDVALRFGPLPDTSATARKIGTVERLLAASPAYLEKAGAPKLPTDLADHAIILGPAGLDPSAWTFRRDNRVVTARIEGKLTISANEGAIAAAVAGLGIVSTGRWGCLAEMRSGTLVQVLSDWQMETAEVHAVFPAGRAAKPAARAFADYLGREMGKYPAAEMACSM
ncbi:MAG: LysR substrate-binding domain-containing protein [Candidatus Acidoferrales bacterium]|nr:LysR substrate-binding domain-containing protein [Candidatus Acidoferrales bacterium]